MKIDDNELKDLLINPKLNSRSHYICDCVFCGKEKHMYVNKNTQMFDCKKCGENGSVYKLLNFLGKLYLLDGATVEYKESLKSIKEITTEEQEEVKLEDLPIIKMPIGWKINRTEYLKSRGITKKNALRYNLGSTSVLEKYNNYVLIPVYDNGKIRGFLGRYGCKKVPKDKLRYNNSRGTDFSKLLFGFDEIVENKTETVIIVEGIFDKIAVDKLLNLDSQEEIKCVSTFGKKISDYQIAKLRSKFISRIIMLYDFDAIVEIKKISFELEKYFFTNIIFTDRKDIDECPYEEALEVFQRIYTPKEFYRNVIGKVSFK